MNHAHSLRLVTDTAIWDQYVRTHNGHVLQSFAWGELKSRFGWRVERYAWGSEGITFAAAQVLYRDLAPALRVAYLPRGPVLSLQNPGEIAEFLDALRLRIQKHGTFLWIVEPDWLREDPRTALLSAAGLVSTSQTIQPPTTIHLDLTPDLDAILVGMKSKWRYNIRLAERKGVRVRQGTREDLSALHALMRVTGERDHFAIHGEAYYRAAFELLTADDSACVLVAEYEGKPLAMIFVTAFAHEAIYLYGASGNEERNRMPNHALHWAAIQWAKARGCTRYDWWGIPANVSEATNTDDKAADASLPDTLYQFKQGFGGQVVLYGGAWEKIFNPALYTVYKLARRVRRSGLA